MSEMSNKPQAGIALLLNFFLGIFGADKFYVGNYDLGILQLILSITFIGLAITIPWTFLCMLSLFIFVFLGGSAFMYPNVQWADISNTDKTIAIILILIMILSPLFRKSTIIQNYNNICPLCHKKDCQCKKEKYEESCTGCSGKRMLPPR
jgi:TM2 domain-containing membrane protein YozV